MIGAFGLFVALTASSAQDGDLKRVEADSALAGRLAAVGKVFSGHGATLSMASGFLVSSCHVLTAGHVLAKAGEQVQLGAEVRFFPGGTSADRALPVTGRVVAASQDFIMEAAPFGFDQKRIPNDWVLIELDRALSGIEPIRLLYPEAVTPADAAYTVVGYPLGQVRQGLFAQEHCRNGSSPHGGTALKGILIADCAVRSGMSGGPMLLDDENQAIAAGIVVERFTIGQKVMTIGVPVAAFAEKMSAAMRDSEICAVGAPFVWPFSLPNR
ncbi:MAG: trypsin-like peptidase domain-containing protein [Azonexaceae bacterium]|nr:trypsin-like peptidase domain-containing protein [Azonexaceae bacterium]